MDLHEVDAEAAERVYPGSAVIRGPYQAVGQRRRRTDQIWSGRHDPGTGEPALVLQGALDPNITSEQARGIHARLQGWKRYSEYPESGHVDLRSADPRRWTEDLAALLGEVESPDR